MFSLFKKKSDESSTNLIVSYNLGCRYCMKGDGVRHNYLLNNASFEKYRKMPEYELVKQLEIWRKEDNHKCQFCNSPNVEVLEVAVNNYPLYEYDRLEDDCEKNNKFVMKLGVDKMNMQIISINPG